MTINTIIEGCRRKKPRCQRELVVQFSPVLLTVARRYAPDNAMAQDILQDSLVRILERIDQYAGTGSFEGWMRRVVISTALKQLDRKWMRR
ncbi:MAG: sigma-70 family RNA polymerase sigma factor, partial [Bacteroidota bacterium]